VVPKWVSFLGISGGALKFLTFVTLFVFALTASATSDIEKIIGDNDLVPVDATASNIPVKYQSLVDAFGKISMGCTATHIGNGYVLTAGHCFWAGEVPTKDQACADTEIQWGLRQGATPYMVSKCEKIVIAQWSGKNDFAVIKVSPIPPVAIAPEMERRAATGDTVTIFSHPDGRPLEWSRLCGVEYKVHPGLPEGTIQHQCDTNPGSSGATIINALTLKVIGIHDGGLAGDSEADPADPNSPISMGMNYGTYIQNSPLGDTLRSLGFN